MDSSENIFSRYAAFTLDRGDFRRCITVQYISVKHTKPKFDNYTDAIMN